MGVIIDYAHPVIAPLKNRRLNPTGVSIEKLFHLVLQAGLGSVERLCFFIFVQRVTALITRYFHQAQPQNQKKTVNRYKKDQRRPFFILRHFLKKLPTRKRKSFPPSPISDKPRQPPLLRRSTSPPTFRQCGCNNGMKNPRRNRSIYFLPQLFFL